MLCCGFLQAVLSESELVQAAADNATMGRAQHLLQEEKDEVKHMNRIMRYAKCAASREKQIVVGHRQSDGALQRSSTLLRSALQSMSAFIKLPAAAHYMLPLLLLNMYAQRLLWPPGKVSWPKASTQLADSWHAI